MSLRVDSSSLIAGALVCGVRGLGVPGASVPSGGDSGPGYLYNDLALPADAQKEVCGRITTWPAGGELLAEEDSSFTYDGVTDTFEYQLYVDGVATGSPVTVYLNVGGQALSVADAAHAHAADNVVLALGGTLITIAAATHAQTADNVTLVLGQLAVADAASAHGSDPVILAVDAWLAVADAEHGQAVYNIAITTGDAAVPLAAGGQRRVQRVSRAARLSQGDRR